MSKKLESVPILDLKVFYFICLGCGNKNYIDDGKELEVEKVRCENCSQSFLVEDKDNLINDDFVNDEEEEEDLEEEEE